MAAKNKIQGKEIKDIEAKLKDIPKKPDDESFFTTKEALQKLLPLVLDLRDNKGYNKTDIIKILNEHGLEVSTYIYDAVMKEARGTKSKSVKAPSPAKIAKQSSRKDGKGVVADIKDI